MSGNQGSSATAHSSRGPFDLFSRLRPVEVFQVRGRLIFFSQHQKPISTQEIVFVADYDLMGAFDAGRSGPARMRIWVAPECFVDAPRPSQGMIDHSDFIMQKILIVRVKMKPLSKD